MRKRDLFLTKAAVIAALYAALTLLGAAFGISYGSIQFRFSEALCVLPLFTPAAVPGLALGCFAANTLSTVSPLDMLFGSAATLFAALLTRAARKIRIRDYPFCSLLMPVLINGVTVGAETAFFASAEQFSKAFAVNALTASVSEAAVVFTLGTALYYGIEKNTALGKLISEK